MGATAGVGGEMAETNFAHAVVHGDFAWQVDLSRFVSWRSLAASFASALFAANDYLVECLEKEPTLASRRSSA